MPFGVIIGFFIVVIAILIVPIWVGNGTTGFWKDIWWCGVKKTGGKAWDGVKKIPGKLWSGIKSIF